MSAVIVRYDDKADVLAGATAESLASAYPECSSLSRLTEMVEATVKVARSLAPGLGAKTKRSQYEWLFDLAGRLRSFLSTEEGSDPGIAGELAPLATVFAEIVLHDGEALAKKNRIEWSDPDAVMLEFESAWAKRKFAKGSTALEDAIEFAKGNPLGVRGNRYFVTVLNVAHYLSLQRPGEPVIVPVTPRLARLMDTTVVTLGSAVAKAVREGYLEEVTASNLRAGKARTFRFNPAPEAVVSK